VRFGASSIARLASAGAISAVRLCCRTAIPKQSLVEHLAILKILKDAASPVTRH
jgi:hypothetical protein